jgi:DNA-binding XRE family transcriptional regulator
MILPYSQTQQDSYTAPPSSISSGTQRAVRSRLTTLERRTDQENSRFIGDRFGLRLRELRLSRKLGQVEMAVAFGIDRSFISDVERGRKSIGLPTLEVIAIGFGMTLSELLQNL